MQLLPLLSLFGLAAVSTVLARKAAYLPPLALHVQHELRNRHSSTYKTYGVSNDTTKDLTDGYNGLPARLRGVQTRCTTPDCFGFAFEDGPAANHTFIADALVKANFKGTFFVNGNKTKCIYDEDSVQRLRHSFAQGHQICNHGWSHATLTANLTYAQIDKQVNLLETALFRILGVVPWCFRPAFGMTNATVTEYLQQRWGYVLINWSDDTLDNKNATAAEQLAIYNNTKPQAVMYHHEQYDQLVNVVPGAIDIIKAKGYTNVQGANTVFNFNGYKVIGKPSKRDATWTCEGKPIAGAA